MESLSRVSSMAERSMGLRKPKNIKHNGKSLPGIIDGGKKYGTYKTKKHQAQWKVAPGYHRCRKEVWDLENRKTSSTMENRSPISCKPTSLFFAANELYY